VKVQGVASQGFVGNEKCNDVVSAPRYFLGKKQVIGTLPTCHKKPFLPFLLILDTFSGTHDMLLRRAEASSRPIEASRIRYDLSLLQPREVPGKLTRMPGNSSSWEAGARAGFPKCWAELAPTSGRLGTPAEPVYVNQRQSAATVAAVAVASDGHRGFDPPYSRASYCGVNGACPRS
jgi:hypothetical protein